MHSRFLSIEKSVLLISLLFLATGLTAQNASATVTNRQGQDDDSQKSKAGGKDWFYTSLEISYVSLNVLDLVTTHFSLKEGAQEANPVTSLYIKNLPLSVLVKGGATAAVLYGLRQVKKEDRRLAFITLGILNVLYGYVVNNNINVYLQVKK
ncbi:MAG: DUF5658 family protein [bacterium]